MSGMSTALRPARSPGTSFGALLREWRRRRRLSQLALALEANVSQRHLSFVESGRAAPSREMVLHLAAVLDVPLRERNQLLLAAGYAPAYSERPLADPALGVARRTIERLLAAHEPYPALAVDRHWNLVAANGATQMMLADVSAELLQPPVNVLRVSLHPAGMASRIANLPQWREHLLERLDHQAEVTADPALHALAAELRTLPMPDAARRRGVVGVAADGGSLFVPLQLQLEDRMLTFFSTTTLFGTPLDVTLAELALESFFPADDATARWLSEHAGPRGSEGG